jgi:hypothetical protein
LRVRVSDLGRPASNSGGASRGEYGVELERLGPNFGRLNEINGRVAPRRFDRRVHRRSALHGVHRLDFQTEGRPHLLVELDGATGHPRSGGRNDSASRRHEGLSNACDERLSGRFPPAPKRVLELDVEVRARR